jgi:hypothetical protein
MIEKEVKTYKEGVNKWRDNRYSFMYEIDINTRVSNLGKAKKTEILKRIYRIR